MKMRHPIPPVTRQRIVQVLPLLLLLLIVYAIYLAATRGRDAKQNEAVQAKESAAWTSEHDRQLALVASVSTPESFQARCGVPSAVSRGINGGDAVSLPAAGVVTFAYRTPPTEMHVIFTRDKEVPILFREHLHNKVYAFAPYEGLVEMGCIQKPNAE